MGAGRENLSHIKRVKFGKMGTAKKKAFLDRVIAHAGVSPGVGHYSTKPNLTNKLDIEPRSTLDWQKYANKTKGRGEPEKLPAPMQYEVKYHLVEKTVPNYTMS